MKKSSQLMQSLSSRQWQAVETHLTCFSDKKEPHEKILRLARLLRNAYSEPACPAGRPDAGKISSTLYWGGENKENAMRLAQRLRNKTLECMLMDFQIRDNPFIACHEKAVIRAYKKYAEYQFLSIGHVPVEIKEDLLNEIICTCKKYELFPLLLSCLEQKRWMEGLRSGMKIFEAITEDMDYYREREKAVSIASGYVLQLKIMYENSGKINPEKVISFLTSSISDLKKQYGRFNSPSILYYLKVLEMDEQSVRNNYTGAKKMCEEIIRLVFAEPSLRIRQRKGIYYAQLAQYEIILRQFDDALGHARLSLDYFPQGGKNYIASQELEFFCLFYTGNYLHAEECMLNMLTAGAKALGKFRYGKYSLLLASARFMQGRNADALSALHNDFSFSSKQAGWEISFRILSILIYFELGMHDEFSRQAELLRKFMAYHAQANDFGTRSGIILKLLRNIEKNDYNFSLENHSFQEMLSELESGNGKYKWEPFTPEIIPFHEWVRKKINSSRTKGN